MPNVSDTFWRGVFDIVIYQIKYGDKYTICHGDLLPSKKIELYEESMQYYDELDTDCGFDSDEERFAAMEEEEQTHCGDCGKEFDPRRKDCAYLVADSFCRSCYDSHYLECHCWSEAEKLNCMCLRRPRIPGWPLEDE